VQKKRRKHETAEHMYFCGGAAESKGGGGDAAATVAHAVMGCDGEEDEDVDAAAALPHGVAPVGAPGVYFCGGERSDIVAASRGA
jgi:hypothetical protein